MSENLLSVLHIQKLGHPIEEIRTRALSSVISKYNLNLVDGTNVENTKLLLEKLLSWFNFCKFSQEEKVLNLILKVLKHENSDLLREIHREDLLKKINEVEQKIGYEFSPIIQDIKECLKKKECIGNDKEHSGVHCINNLPDFHKNAPEVEIEYVDSYPQRSKHIKRTFKISEENFHDDTSKRSAKEVLRKKSLFRVEYFPWQYLLPSDKHLLLSVYEGVRYLDNGTSILQTCRFFKQVVLRNFPAEVFIQRPLVVRTFLELIEASNENIRIPVIENLIQTVQYLKLSIHAASNVSLFHSKEEFNSVSVFPNTVVNGNQSFSADLPEYFHLNSAFINGQSFSNENDCQDHNLKKYQISVPNFCFEILFQIFPYLGKKCGEEEVNVLVELSYETITCLVCNLKCDIWNDENNFKEKFYKVFGIIQDSLIYCKEKNQVLYVVLLYFTIKLLNSLKPPSVYELSEILPRRLQCELGACISNSALVLLFPQLHSEIQKYIEKLLGQNQKEVIQDYKDVLNIVESMKASLKFLKSSSFNTKIEKLECVNKGLLSLDFHQNYEFICLYVKTCLLKWNKSQLNEKELMVQNSVLIKLLSHSNDFVKVAIYKEICKYAVKLLGVDEAVHPKYEFPGNKMDFLFHVDVLTEIICHGLKSSIVEITKYSNEILVLLLKSRFIMSDDCWDDFMQALIPCFCFLQCFADKNTALGRCIVKMFDPDLAKTTGLPVIEILKGNIRLLFSKNNLTRDEGISRLFWLLSREDASEKKLPRLGVLIGLNLSGVCSSVKPQEFTKICQSFYNPSRLCDVMEMLKAENLEPGLRRSALSQLNMMMDDVLLHPTFLEQNGVDIILKILDNCLVEREFMNYPDSVMPIVDILKLVSLQNASVRQQLSSNISVFYNLLRGLFLFSSDDSFRRNAVELLCILLYSDCILRVPPDKSIKCTISFPELIVTSMCLPFLTHTHWRHSKHLEPSLRKTLMDKDNCAKLIRINWAVQWVGSLCDLLTIQEFDLEEKTFSPGIPDDLKISFRDIEYLRKCAFGPSVKQTLFNIQNATTHEEVLFCLQKLKSYLLLYNIDRTTNGKSCRDISSDTILSHMLWESTLERFMVSAPSNKEDKTLLLKIIKLLHLLLRSFKSDRLIDWVGKLLIEDHHPLTLIRKSIGNHDKDHNEIELHLGLVELTQQIVTLKCSLNTNKWFLYMDFIPEQLKLDDEQEFYNVAQVDWLLSLLVDLTGKWIWNFENRTRYLENLITRILKIIIAFHCTKDSAISFTGLNIIKNSVLVLNHILSDSQTSVKEWEKLWHQALSKIVGQAKDINYCWLLSLWFTRDSVLRSAAFLLFVGFSASSQACELLLDQLNINLEHIWNYAFNILFDENECCFVREKSALLLSNLIFRGLKLSFGCMLQNMEKINFYQEIYKIILNFQYEATLSEVTLEHIKNSFSGRVMTTPSFVKSICVLLENLISHNPKVISEKIFLSGIYEGLIRVLGEIPHTANVCGRHQDCVDIIEMYIAVCKLITNCTLHNSTLHSATLHSQPCVNCVFQMIDHNLFCDESRVITAYRNELWCSVLDLFSVMLMDNADSKNKNENNVGFVLINRSMTENGVDQFISSLYIALSCDVHELRLSVLRFLVNFFRCETNSPNDISISDMLDRKISTKALKLSIKNAWKGFTISESLTLNFGIRVADLLFQTFLLSDGDVSKSNKSIVAAALGSLFVISTPAQNFSLEHGLLEAVITSLKQICIKLSLENVDNFKKLSYKKRIDPLLVDLENLFKLISNLTYKNDKAKIAVADCVLSAIVHKFWPWCLAKRSLLIVALMMLCTCTYSCDQGCRTLVLSTSLAVLGLKKSPGPVTLMNSIINQVSLEMNGISKTHDSKVLCLCLQLISNCCRVTECRSVLSKGNFLMSFTKVHPNRKNRSPDYTAVESWLKFLIIFSTYQEGQLALTKTQDVLDILLSLASSSEMNRVGALTILRNICFHQLNRVRMLNCTTFISLMYESLDSKRRDEIQPIVTMIWALSCNTQKAKIILRSSGFEAKLVAAKRYYVLKDDKETVDLIEVVLEILKNK